MSLRSCQRWLWQAILGRADAMSAMPVHADGLAPTDRVGIYANGYRLRLLQCLQAEFGVLAGLLGETVFNRFAADYLSQRPSTSYTLHDLGQGFPVFLEDTRPDRAAGADREPLFDAMIDLAMLERLVFETYDGDGNEGDATSGPVRPAFSARLLRLRFPAHRYLVVADDEREQLGMEPATTCLVVYRQNYRVMIDEMNAVEFALAERVLAGELSAVMDEVLAGAGTGGLLRWQQRNIQRGLLVGQL